MKETKYIKIEVEKRYMGKAYINRFMHLLNLIAPGRYELNTWNGLASIEDTITQLTVANFSDNPF
jgi:hypothetical protein